MELRRRVDEYFERTGRCRRDCPSLYLKSGVILASVAGLYVLLVFFAGAWWQAVPLAVLLGLATAGVGLNIQHEGGHDAFSARPWVNTLAATTLDLIGGSSYVWHYRHSVLHHTYVNITGHDTDIDLGALGRLTPYQKRLAVHRWQHLYMWPLYGLMAIRWQIFGDYLDVIHGRLGEHPIPRPRGWNLAVFLGGKATFLVLALGIPMLIHPWWVVLVYYGVVGMVVGITLSIVFQLAHAVECAEFAAPTDVNLIENAWAIHQTESTVDFSRRSRMVSWLLGGLNYQIEHHLFPRISHVNYPAMSRIVEETCREFGVRYNEHATFRAGLASHYRWLRRMGLPEGAG
ncbi:MAG: acyl-CoA desaturase [Phycisphaerales bacterium]